MKIKHLIIMREREGEKVIFGEKETYRTSTKSSEAVFRRRRYSLTKQPVVAELLLLLLLLIVLVVSVAFVSDIF
uniref:Single tm domain protein n=1 Tax=Schistosoma curassoni TaxID=6186 RepID=A0A183JJD4_9TREM